MDSINELRIDPEFEEKIPPLTDDEFTQLEANIMAEGALLSPLIVWDGVIVDGHNRYRIIQKHPEIHFEVREKKFENRFEAVAWICRNQLGRRNLTEIQKRMLIGKQYEAEKAVHGFDEKSQTRDEHGQFRRSGQNDHFGETEKTRQRIARENGVSESYVRHAEKFIQGVEAADEVLPGIKQKISVGTVKPTVKAVEAIARASPEARRELVEQLQQPRPSPKKRGKHEDSPPENADTFADDEPTPTALSISERMASTPERVNRDSPVDFIITELTDALDGMIFRWDFCLSDNKTTASSEECCRQIRELAAKGITYLKSYQGRKKKK